MALEQTDLGDRVRSAAGSTADVKGSYGGLEITVLDPEAFPWPSVMDALTDVGQDVWVVRRDGVLMVRSKPPAI